MTLLHKIIAARIMNAVPFNPRQKGFLNADGCGENIFLLNSILHEARSSVRPVTVAYVDMKKAFDSVSHDTIIRCGRRMGIPPGLLGYIQDSYKETSTMLLGARIETRRGVRQGDPLSPVLFNCVIDEVLDSLSSDIGFTLNNNTIPSLAFADDLAVIAETGSACEAQLNTLLTVLNKGGLEVNHVKCAALRIEVNRKSKKWFINPSLISIQGCPIPVIDWSNSYKYLGINIGGVRREANMKDKLAAGLHAISSAPIKPQQKIFTLKTILIPQLVHKLTFGTINKSSLKALDKNIRHHIRLWLHLPKDTTDAYIHAHIDDGGLGVPSLVHLTSRLKCSRIEALNKSKDQAVRAILDTSFARQFIQKWSQPTKISHHYVGSKPAERRAWQETLYTSHDGKGLKWHNLVPTAHSWLKGCPAMPGRDYINYIKVRGNLLSTKTRCSRGNRDVNTSCNMGCTEAESLVHILQRCYKTQGFRILRHDRLVKLLADESSKIGYISTKEPRIHTTAGLKKPDIILHKDNQAFIVDAQVVTDATPLDVAHSNKIAHYDNDQIRQWCIQNLHVSTCHFSSLTLNWRGAMARESAILINNLLHLPNKVINKISRYTLSGSNMIYRHFTDSTSRV
jgi:hypothetical protein